MPTKFAPFLTAESQKNWKNCLIRPAHPIDLTDPDKPLDLLLNETGVETLQALLPKVKLTKLVLGYVSRIQLILNALPSCGLNTLNLSKTKIYTEGKDGLAPYPLQKRHIDSLEEFLGSLHEQSAFRCLVVDIEDRPLADIDQLKRMREAARKKGIRVELLDSTKLASPEREAESRLILELQNMHLDAKKKQRRNRRGTSRFRQAANPIASH